MRFRATFLKTILFVAAMTPLPETASARDAVCYGLEDELARLSSLPRGGGRGGAEVRQWDEALRAAGARLQDLERHLRRTQCDGGGFLFSSPDPRMCDALERDIADTRADMARLSRNRAIALRRSGSSDVEARIAAVRRELAANRCVPPGYEARSRRAPGRAAPPPSSARGPRYTTDSGGRVFARSAPDRNGVVDARPMDRAGPENRDRGFFSMFFGGDRRYRRDDDYDYGYGDPAYRGGTYRTLCVRSCDGFFFPISFSTTSQQFDGDAAQCQAMCPGTDARLFVHRNPGEDVSAMVSLDGAAYTDLENAFRYRTEFDADCSCRAANMSVAGAYGNRYSGALNPVSGGSDLEALNESGDDLAALGDAGISVFDGNDPWSGLRGRAEDAPLTDAIPLAKLDASEDPDTTLNQRGGYVPQLAKPAPVQQADASASQDGAAGAAEAPSGEVRRVGPAYFVAQ